MMSPEERRRLAAAFILLVLGLAASALLPAHRPLPFELCVLHRLTGLPCLTCGLTRSVCLILQGRWTEGIGMHPAGPMAVLLAAGSALWLGMEAMAGRPLAPRLRGRALRLLAGAGGVISLVAWVGRVGEALYQR
jgi:hypothetical protein